VRHAAEQGRPDVRRKRAAFRGRTAYVDRDRFVFLDETGTNTALARLYGRAPRGERAVGRVPAARWETSTLIAAIRSDGVVGSLVFRGATDALAFRAYVDEVLVPALRPGDIVVLDNLKAHQAGAIARAIRKAGAGVWYLPPYSPDFNPIENAIAKVKAMLRKLAKRTVPELFDAIDEALNSVTSSDARAFIEHCGYATKRRKRL
jgi:transposase